MIGPRDAGALTTSETVESTKGPRVASACTAAVTSETAFDGDEIPNSPVPLDILLSFAFQWWREFTTFDPGNDATTFPVENVDQMVIVSGIDTWSLCAHHLLPFSATLSIGYVADKQVLGLSKFARIAHSAAHHPTSQEELVARVADRVQEVTGSGDVAVKASGLHLCMAMRGVKTPASMTTSVTRGVFREGGSARAEWLALMDSTH